MGSTSHQLATKKVSIEISQVRNCWPDRNHLL